MNYFELFALPQGFELDSATLATRYRELQRAVHPDNFAAGSDRDRLMAVQKTAEINDAFQTLKSPLGRAEYLLRLNGVELRGETTTIKDPMFLMQQMELREALADLADHDDPFDAALALEQEFAAIKKAMMTNLISQLDNKLWLDAADNVRKLKFVDKLEQELALLEEQWQL
ncbi:co-chaperone HscB [Ferrimonas lipolytica]|uniref:Co-chaperone protein HscB homolog n=1 Tax=Ferrimonas lipolytica TaxID=2724191 RepID=A0A6H1UD16_9GAMM|nr:co-chaperone HscB [Ferrimonas lipolytica]QIZ76997.1 co-chaperone HscB [Ferrimonas lipolytica]